ETAWESVKCAFIGFLVPFVFVYNPEMLGLEGLGRAIEVLMISSAGTLLAASGIVGYWDRPLKWFERLAMAAAGVMFIVPETETRIAGIVIGLIMIIMFWQRSRRRPGVQDVKASGRQE
ncbi:MAG TPA: hypothetical protein VEU07_07220, partial [Candidatus Acidoferrum sp.]|nr:hypothetical protein [Candidatus Acidoferrum sp.]